MTWSAVEIDVLEGEAKNYSVHLHVISAFAMHMGSPVFPRENGP